MSRTYRGVSASLLEGADAPADTSWRADEFPAAPTTVTQIQKVASYLQRMTLGEVAERAVGGDKEAETAIKIVKDAKRLSEKGGG